MIITSRIFHPPRTYLENNSLNPSDASVIASIDKISATTDANSGELYYVPSVRYGDVNTDGLIGTPDLLDMRRFIVGDSFSEGKFDKEAANVYYDGNIDLMDVLTLRRYILQWHNFLPITQ
jgi:hypothetical protein